MQEINFFNRKVSLTIINHGVTISKQDVKELEHSFKEKFRSIEMTKVEIGLYLTPSQGLKNLFPIIFGGTTIKAENAENGIGFAYTSVHKETETQTMTSMMNRALLALIILSKLNPTQEDVERLGESMSALPQNDAIEECTPGHDRGDRPPFQKIATDKISNPAPYGESPTRLAFLF